MIIAERAHMRHSVLLASLGLPFVLATAARETRACQPPPADLIGFSASFPADGATDVAVDTGIVLFGTVLIAAGNDFHDPLEVESIELIDQGGQPVPGKMVPWRSSEGELELAWAPSSPLVSDSSYTLGATISRAYAVDEYTEEELALGATLSASFTTGSATTAPLSAGALGLRATEIEVDIQDCPNVGDCGISCVVVDRRTYPQLEVTVPDVEGGNDAAGYSAYLAVSAGSPLPFTGIEAPKGTDSTPLIRLSHEAIPSDGPSEVAIPLYVEDTEPFVPCVSAIVWDPSGKSVILEPVCATEVVVPPSTRGEGGAGGTSGLGGSAGALSATGGSVSATSGSAGDDGSTGAKPEEGGHGAGGHAEATGGGSDDDDGNAGARSATGGAGDDVSTTGEAGTGGAEADAGRAGSTPALEASRGADQHGGCSGCRTSRTPVSPIAPLVAVVLLASARRRSPSSRSRVRARPDARP
jgi:hypothetical protein